MRHGYKKIKFKAGKDSTKMLLRKLTTSFIKSGKIISTEKRIKTLRSYFDKLVKKAREKTEANKNYLLRVLGDKKIIDMLFDQVGQLSRDKMGGYVRIVKLHQRISDGALNCRLEWAYPVVVETKKVEKVKEVKKSK